TQAVPDEQRGLVDTGVALRVVGRIATDPLEGSYLLEDLARHFAELVAEAEPLVAEEAGFGPATPARSRVMSRSEWASANVTSIVNLLSPLLDKIDARLPPGSGGGLTRRAYGSALGAQLGGAVGVGDGLGRPAASPPADALGDAEALGLGEAGAGAGAAPPGPPCTVMVPVMPWRA
ncbi:MAG TPA: zinc-dependent metalloprotease, partial [Actinomycetota bacterium]|nr:zinc-dependent metalloprotease [Actinomycetota bacterium]